MTLYLNLLSVFLLAMVAGLLMALWLQLRGWREANKNAPLLAEQLAEHLLAARKGLADLKAALTTSSPELNRLLGEGGKLRVELQYILQRGEQLAQKLEAQTNQQTTLQGGIQLAAPAKNGQKAAVESAASVERVAGANGQAASRNLTKPGQPDPTDSDPLEELLAGLQQGSETPIAKTPKRKRAGTVTQAELDLQQSLQRKDTH